MPDYLSVNLYEEIMKNAAEKADTEFFSLHIVKDNVSKPHLITNYPKEWLSLYKSRHLQNIDFALKRSLASSEPYVWGYHCMDDLDIEELNLFTVSDFHGIRSGITSHIQFPNHNGYAFITFSNSTKHLDKEIYDKNIEPIKNCLSLVAALSFIEKSEKEGDHGFCRILLEDIYHGFFDSSARDKIKKLKYDKNDSPQQNVAMGYIDMLFHDARN